MTGYALEYLAKLRSQLVCSVAFKRITLQRGGLSLNPNSFLLDPRPKNSWKRMFRVPGSAAYSSKRMRNILCPNLLNWKELASEVHFSDNAYKKPQWLTIRVLLAAAGLILVVQKFHLCSLLHITEDFISHSTKDVLRFLDLCSSPLSGLET